MLTLTFVHPADPTPGEPCARFGPGGGTLGRAEGNTLVLPDTERVISRLHAEVLCQAGGYALRHLGRNPTWLNGVACAPDAVLPLSNGDVIRIGAFELVVALGAPADAVEEGPDEGLNEAVAAETAPAPAPQAPADPPPPPAPVADPLVQPLFAAYPSLLSEIDAQPPGDGGPAHDPFGDTVLLDLPAPPDTAKALAPPDAAADHADSLLSAMQAQLGGSGWRVSGEQQPDPFAPADRSGSRAAPVPSTPALDDSPWRATAPTVLPPPVAVVPPPAVVEPAAPSRAPVPTPAPATARAPADPAELVGALVAGLGLGPSGADRLTPALLHHIGRRLRAEAEGVEAPPGHSAEAERLRALLRPPRP